MRSLRCLAVLACVGAAACTGRVSEQGPDGGVTPDSGSTLDGGVSTDAGRDAGASDAGGTDAGTALACDTPDAGIGGPTGTTRDLNPGGTLGALLQASQPGDHIVVHAGTYPAEQLTVSFTDYVYVDVAPGQSASFASLTFTASQYVVLRGLSFPGGLTLDGSSHFVLEGLTIELGAVDATALTFEGQHSAGACHDVFVTNSKIWGGARTIFILGNFAPSVQWNHDLTFVNNDFACGTHNCFQLSGGRDILIEKNTFHDPLGDGVLTAGATRIQILRNRMIGNPAVSSTAVRLATPGMEWDNYAGVQNMISSDITVANNVINSWGSAGLELDAATNIRFVYNTVDSTVGYKTWARVPHDQQGNVILTGDTQVMLWNNILPSLAIDSNDSALTLESNNLVGTSPQYASTTTYQLSPTSPAVGMALLNAQTPWMDFAGAARGPQPDIGALQHDGVPVCP